MEGKRPDRSFEKEVLAEPGGENLYRCYSCGTCASACLVRRVNSDFNPRLILRMVMLGMREEVLASPVVWLCSACDLCYSLCPQQIHISELMKAIRNIAIREGYEPPGPIAKVDEELCSGCGMCATACSYEGIKLVSRSMSENGHKVAQVDKFRCMDCGICAATCPSEAIRVEEFSREKAIVRMQAGGWLRSEIEPKIVLFICNWCLRAEDDLVCLHRFPSHIRVVNVPCTGQVDSSLILAALAGGADGVLIIGCQPGECHYQKGNLLARRRVLETKPLLTALGIGDERLRLEWISTMDNCSRFCHSTTVPALASTVGSGVMPTSQTDIEQADCILIAGVNIKETYPLIARRIIRAKQRGTTVIVVDPRKTVTARSLADIHLQLRPGTDVPLVNAMIKTVLHEGLEDRDFIETRTKGFEELRARLEASDAGELAEIAGVPIDAIKEAARTYAQAERGCILYNAGVAQHADGIANIRALANLAMLTGNYGRPGTGVNPLRDHLNGGGHLNGEGFGDMGPLPVFYPGSRPVNEETARLFEG